MSSLTSVRSSASLRQTLAQLPRDARDTLFLLVVIAWVIDPQHPTLPVWTPLLEGGDLGGDHPGNRLSIIHSSEPLRLSMSACATFCL